jgi:hypothetical protein
MASIWALVKSPKSISEWRLPDSETSEVHGVPASEPYSRWELSTRVSAGRSVDRNAVAAVSRYRAGEAANDSSLVMPTGVENGSQAARWHHERVWMHTSGLELPTDDPVAQAITT